MTSVPDIRFGSFANLFWKNRIFEVETIKTNGCETTKILQKFKRDMLAGLKN